MSRNSWQCKIKTKKGADWNLVGAFLTLRSTENMTNNENACNIISKYNGIIRKVRQFLPSDSLPTLFNTLVYPYINYCAIIWADNNNSHRDSILPLQKRIVRMCTNSVWLKHTNPLFQSLNTLKIQDLHSLQVGIFMYQFHHNLFPDDLFEPNYFTMNNKS